MKQLMPPPTTRHLGRHLLAEFYDCDSNILNNEPLLEEIMTEAAVACGATVVTKSFHQFNPYGVSGVVIIAESHLAIHTWPELGYAAVDLFTCGDSCDPKIAYDVMRDRMHAGKAFYSELNRGIVDPESHALVESPFLVKQQLHHSGPLTEQETRQVAVAQAMRGGD